MSVTDESVPVLVAGNVLQMTHAKDYGAAGLCDGGVTFVVN